MRLLLSQIESNFINKFPSIILTWYGEKIGYLYKLLSCIIKIQITNASKALKMRHILSHHTPI